MPFIGNQPALSYTSFAKQDFTTSATTSYTLDNPVANENEIALFINFVRQEPTTAYTASGTSLTLTSATSASDDMYCVFLGKAVQTVNPPSGSVGTAQIADLAVTSGKLASGVLPTNTPAFIAYNSSTTQSISNATYTVYQYNTKVLDTDNGFNTSTYTYTVPSAGKYIIGGTAKKLSSGSTDRLIMRLEKNGSNTFYSETYSKDNASVLFNTFLDLSASDALKISIYQNTGGSVDFEGGSHTNVFFGYKIIE